MTAFDRIKKLSEQRGWSLQTVAEKAGLGKNSIYKWKQQTPNLDKLTSVAKVLGTSVDYLLGNTEDDSSATKSSGTAEVIAAHIDDDTSETEREQIINFIENLKRARKQD